MTRFTTVRFEIGHCHVCLRSMNAVSRNRYDFKTLSLGCNYFALYRNKIMALLSYLKYASARKISAASALDQ